MSLTLQEIKKERESKLHDELLSRFSKSGGASKLRSFRFFAKRCAWKAVVGGTIAFKRLADILIAGSAILCLAPVMGLLALAIRLESRGPVFFAQTRVGKWGRLFTMYKLRSMYIDAEKRKAALQAKNEMNGGVLFKMKDDPRITKIGKIIRKLSLDELPQLWNVFLGDMSLVGPRPPLPSEVKEYTVSDRRRLDMKPGITCIWQVSGRSDIPF
ncbi:MAG: sugar transferase, partial [Planctomycetota bacterium]